MQSDHEKGYDRGGMGRRGFLARLGLGAAGAAACAGGANAKQLVSAIDYAPTFCHMLGIDDQEQMDGRNAWDLVTGKAGRLHDRVFTQFGNFAAVRNKKWHYFQHLSGPERGAGPCLYDLEADPGEKTNVIGQHAQVAAEMRGQIADRLQQKLPVVATEPG